MNFISFVKRIIVPFIDELVIKDALCIMILFEAHFVLELQNILYQNTRIKPLFILFVG